MKKGVLRNFTKFTGKHLRQSLLFNKVAGLRHHKKQPLYKDFTKDRENWQVVVNYKDVHSLFQKVNLQREVKNNY